MIDENKIIEAAIKNADKYNPCRSTLDMEEVCRASFANGVKWFKQAIWHDISEEPEHSKFVLAQRKTFIGELRYYLYETNSTYPWELNVRDLRIIKWCYIEDLLPKGGEK